MPALSNKQAGKWPSGIPVAGGDQDAQPGRAAALDKQDWNPRRLPQDRLARYEKQ